MSRLFVVVDMQKDFIDGSLGTKEAQGITKRVAEKIKRYVEEGWEIIFTQDSHSKDYLQTQEGRRLPVEHCIKGTAGWEICEEVQKSVTLPKYKVYEKGTFGSDRYAMDLAHGKFAGVTEVELVGLCTDICVISNAILTKTFLLEAKVSVDASCCAGVTQESHKNALEAMKMCQIDVFGEWSVIKPDTI